MIYIYFSPIALENSQCSRGQISHREKWNAPLNVGMTTQTATWAEEYTLVTQIIEKIRNNSVMVYYSEVNVNLGLLEQIYVDHSL